MPRGKKICPECSTEQGVRTFVCQCGYDFSAAKEKREKAAAEEKKAKTQSKEKTAHVAEKQYDIPEYCPPPKMTKRDHAQEVIDRGRAKLWLSFHDSGASWASWSHIDWDYIREHVRKEKIHET